MAKGPKPVELQLSEEERNELQALLRRHSTPQQLAQRGCMILRAADGKRNAQICAGYLRHLFEKPVCYA